MQGLPSIAGDAVGAGDALRTLLALYKPLGDNIVGFPEMLGPG